MKDKLASLSFIAAPLCSAVVLDADRDIEGLEARFGDGNAVHIRLSGTADAPWSTNGSVSAAGPRQQIGVCWQGSHESDAGVYGEGG
ncbi:hypothetical protein [Paraburkholderia tropica]|uniref:hypothetical protein n=2 Tax=Paraburkholderia TaxID=1822464 RepID=UPI0011B4334F|nr:hypothetical protein [Paraburkholderia tropica]